MFEVKRETKQGDLLSRLLLSTVLQAALEDDLKRWQEKGQGIHLGDLQTDCLTNLRCVDDVLTFSTSLEQLRGMLCDFKKSTECMGLNIHTGNTKILSNHGSDKRKEVSTDNNIRAAGDNRNQMPNTSSVGIISQVQAGSHIETVPSTTQTSSIQHGDHSLADLRLWNLDPLERT